MKGLRSIITSFKKLSVSGAGVSKLAKSVRQLIADIKKMAAAARLAKKNSKTLSDSISALNKKQGSGSPFKRMQAGIKSFGKSLKTLKKNVSAPFLALNKAAKKSVKAIKSIRNGIGRVVRGIFNLKTAVGGLAIGAAFGALAKSIKTAFDFESYEMQFKILTGSLRQALSRMKELKKFAAETPFEMPEIAKASRLLSVFSDNVIGGTKSLRLMGDAAAATGTRIDDVAFWYGRAYSLINAGKPFGEAALRLQEMGIISAKGAVKIRELQESVDTKPAEILATLNAELGKFAGGMKQLEATGNGLISVLRSQWTETVARFGDTFKNSAKYGIQAIIDKLVELRENGTIQHWAESAKKCS